MENSVDPDQLAFHFFFKSGFNMETGEDMYKLLSLFSNPDIFIQMLLEMYVTNTVYMINIF